jgi:hypothetical protein
MDIHHMITEAKKKIDTPWTSWWKSLSLDARAYGIKEIMLSSMRTFLNL